MHIKVKELVRANAITLTDGEALYHRIHDSLVKGESVELDFEGVQVFASPFFNAAVGRLLGDPGSCAVHREASRKARAGNSESP